MCDHGSCLHAIAHGAPGRVEFSAGAWTRETLADEADDLAAIGEALGEDGGLRLWSCYAGAGEEGKTLVAWLATAAGAKVAAASGLVGAEALGGTWELDGAEAPLTAAGAASYAEVMPSPVWIGSGGTVIAHLG